MRVVSRTTSLSAASKLAFSQGAAVLRRTKGHYASCPLNAERTTGLVTVCPCTGGGGGGVGASEPHGRVNPRAVGTSGEASVWPCGSEASNPPTLRVE